MTQTLPKSPHSSSVCSKISHLSPYLCGSVWPWGRSVGSSALLINQPILPLRPAAAATHVLLPSSGGLLQSWTSSQLSSPRIQCPSVLRPVREKQSLMMAYWLASPWRRARMSLFIPQSPCISCRTLFPLCCIQICLSKNKGSSPLWHWLFKLINRLILC